MIRTYLLLAAIAAVFSAGVVADRFAPIVGANARIARANDAAQAWRRAYGAWKAYATAEATAFRHAESLRRAENARAVRAMDAAADLCVARVARARASSAAIAAVVLKEPRHDPQGCPLRELVPAERLRDAVSPAASR